MPKQKSKTRHDEIASQLFSRLLSPPKLSVSSLYDQQQSFVDSDSVYTGFVAGIGSGKTYAGCIRSLKASQGRIGSRSIPTPNLGIITAPTYPMLRDATAKTFQEVADDFIAKFNRGDMTIKLKNGSEVLLRTADNPDRLRGPNISWWYGDEAALYRNNVWQIMIGRLRQFGQMGSAWLTTTPRGRNWVYKTFVDRDPDRYNLIRATTYDNIFLADEILSEWSGEYTGDFARQELMGEFIAHQGLVYDEFSQDRHIFTSTQKDFKEIVCGVDWGYSNPGVILVGGIDGDGRIHIIAERYERQRQIADWVDIALDLQASYGVSRFVCDPSEPKYISAFQESGLKAIKADNSVMAGIQRVKNRLTTWGDDSGVKLPRLVIARGCVNLISEFEQYQWRETKDGYQDAPIKANDHAMDALRYLIMSVDNPRVKKLKARTVRYD